MSAEKGSVTINIMGKDYKIGCTPAEAEELQKSARHLNQQMSQIKSRGGTHSFETIAILAGLNISHDLIKLNGNSSSSKENSTRDLQHLEEKIDKALQRARQMEI